MLPSIAYQWVNQSQRIIPAVLLLNVDKDKNKINIVLFII